MLTIVYWRIEGADYQQCDAHIVKPPNELGDMPCTAAKEVADCGGQQAQHGASCEHIHRPPLDRPCDIQQGCSCSENPQLKSPVP